MEKVSSVKDSKLENPNRELKVTSVTGISFCSSLDSKLENPNRELKDVSLERLLENGKYRIQN